MYMYMSTCMPELCVWRGNGWKTGGLVGMLITDIPENLSTFSVQVYFVFSTCTMLLVYPVNVMAYAIMPLLFRWDFGCMYAYLGWHTILQKPLKVVFLICDVMCVCVCDCIH